jgi:hypothetical protein
VTACVGGAVIEGLEEGGFDPSVLARPGAEVDPADDDFLPPPDMRALALNLSSTPENFGYVTAYGNVIGYVTAYRYVTVYVTVN